MVHINFNYLRYSMVMLHLNICNNELLTILCKTKFDTCRTSLLECTKEHISGWMSTLSKRWYMKQTYLLWCLKPDPFSWYPFPPKRQVKSILKYTKFWFAFSTLFGTRFFTAVRVLESLCVNWMLVATLNSFILLCNSLNESNNSPIVKEIVPPAS